MEMLAFLTLDIAWLLSFIIQNSWEACNQGTGLYYSELSERRGLGEDLNSASDKCGKCHFKHSCVNSRSLLRKAMHS